MTHFDWCLYFKGLVASHKLLTFRNRKSFFLGEYDEFFSQFRSQVTFPAFIMESSQLDVVMPAQQNLIKRTLAFIVVQKFQRDVHADIQKQLAFCESVGLDLLGRLQEDIHSEAMSQVRLLDIHAEPCMNSPQHYCGWRFEFVVVDPTCMYQRNNWNDANTGKLLQECGHGIFTEDNQNLSLDD